MVRRRSLLFFLFTFVLIGCGDSASRPALTPVTGTVIYQDKPVEGATVTFSTESSSRSSSGVTDSNGKFSLTTFDTNDGAPVGQHVVTIAKAEAQADSSASSTGLGKSPEEMKAMMAQQKAKMQASFAAGPAKMVLPAKYADAKTSGETRTVAAGDSNDFKFDLKD